MKKKLFIISSEKIFSDNGNFFCDNLDMKSTPEGMEKYFNIELIAKKSTIPRAHKIKNKFIGTFSNLFTYIFKIINSAKEKGAHFLIISLSPYTFIACIFLRCFGIKPFLYLRSNGYDEYKIILGHFGYAIYHFMFSIVSKISILISCREYILMNKKGYVVVPSQLNHTWKENISTPSFEKCNLIYVGRIRKEKGIFSLLEIIKNHPEINLTIVGAEKNIHKFKNKNIQTIDIQNNQKDLINLYDKNDIMILPSYTEGYPMVVLEALSRERPVIIFKEIEHIIGNLKGIFVAERNSKSLISKINYISNNYDFIQRSMKENYLPTNSEFIDQMKEIILKN
tara:strand:+ start:2132 stop:3148 length:1017 start_codon:yes stop_codon:yes gene_type:complete